QAMNYAVDKEALRQAVYAGFGKVTDGQDVGQEAFGYNPDIKAYPFDVAKAKQLLAQAGYPTGFSLKYSYTPQLGGIWADPLQGMWGAAGIKIELEPIEPAVLTARKAAGNLGPLTFFGNDYFPVFDSDPNLRVYSNGLPAPNRVWENASYNDV